MNTPITRPDHLVESMTKREFFAALALQGILTYSDGIDTEYAAARAVKRADSLIAELNKTTT